MNHTSGTGSAAGREILSTRLFDAPREILWDAFRDPARLVQWWGPSGFSNVFREFDFRPGGAWHLVMRSPDGAEFSMQKRFVAIAAPERIVMDHIDPVHGFRMTMTFGDRAGKTEVAWQMVFDSADEAAKVRAFVIAANEENFDRLAAHVSKGPTG